MRTTRNHHAAPVNRIQVQVVMRALELKLGLVSACSLKTEFDEVEVPSNAGTSIVRLADTKLAFAEGKAQCATTFRPFQYMDAPSEHLPYLTYL